MYSIELVASKTKQPLMKAAWLQGHGKIAAFCPSLVVSVVRQSQLKMHLQEGESPESAARSANAHGRRGRFLVGF